MQRTTYLKNPFNKQTKANVQRLLPGLQNIFWSKDYVLITILAVMPKAESQTYQTPTNAQKIDKLVITISNYCF